MVGPKQWSSPRTPRREDGWRSDSQRRRLHQKPAAGSRVGRVLKGSRAKTDDIYADQGFGQKLGLGRCPALVVVDFTNGFADTAMLGGGNIRDAILATRPVLEACRRRGLPIVFTRVVYAEDGSDSSLWCEKVPRLRKFTEMASASG